MRLIALSEIFSALNPCQRPSKRPVVVLSPALGLHSWGKELSPVVLEVAGLGPLV